MEELNQRDFDSSLQKNTFVLADFFSSGCRPCKLLTPILEELSGQHQNITFIKVNIEDNDELIDRYNISSVPTLIFFKNGVAKDRQEGLLPKATLTTWLNNQINE